MFHNEIHLRSEKTYYTMKLLRFILPAMLLLACTNGSKMQKINVNDCITQLEVSGFSQESVVPGVYSNLRKVRNYKWQLSGQFEKDMKVIGLQVDSVLIPVRSIKLNDQSIDHTTIAEADYGDYEFRASRKFYNAEAPKRVEEVEYEKMEPILPNTEGILWLSFKDQKIPVKLGDAEVKETVIAP